MKSVCAKSSASLLIVPALLMIAGCGGAPERALPEMNIDMPEEWTVPAGGDYPSAIWWDEFADPGLDSVVAEALRSNFNLAAAVARLDQAAAAAKIAGADLYPQLNATGRGARQRNNLIGIPIPVAGGGVLTTYSNSFGVSLESQWEVDLWGRIRSGKSAAAAAYQASRADLAAARLSIAVQAAKAWFALQEATLQVELAEETVASYRRSNDRLRRRYEQGLRSSLDYRLSISNLAASEALLEMRLQGLDVAKRQLEVLLGRYPGGAIESVGELPRLTGGVPGGLPSDLLIRRPDLVAAERRLAASEKRHGESKRALLPRITLTASGGTLSEELGDILSGDFKVWSIAAGLFQPLFQGGRLRANVSRSGAVADEALAAYVGSVLLAFAEVESSLFAESALARREAHLATAAGEAESAWKLAERQYDSGLADYITLLETQRRSLNAKSELITVRRSRLDARTNLYLALGGGFEMDDQ